MCADFLTEDEKYISWRYEQLRAAGCDEHDAELMADHLEVSLHDALELMERGCPSGTMVAILL